MAKCGKAKEYRLHFFCPGCARVHGIIYQGKNVWDWNGDLDRPTISPSILVLGGPENARCHSFVIDGQIQFLGDCTHSLAGQTVPLPDWPYS